MSEKKLKICNSKCEVMSEEYQELMFDELMSRYFQLLHNGNSMYAAVKLLQLQFTITRKS
jgi:hypothetical protein